MRAATNDLPRIPARSVENAIRLRAKWQQRAHRLVAPAQQCSKECSPTDPARGWKLARGLAITGISSHGLAMICIRQSNRALALMVITLLVAASTVVPSLTHAQKYADHLGQYGGYDARVAAISGIASLYLSPEAPMLPVVLSVPSDADMATLLPSSCSMDKTVLPSVASHSVPQEQVIGFVVPETYPVSLDPTALRGPPRQNA